MASRYDGNFGHAASRADDRGSRRCRTYFDRSPSSVLRAVLSGGGGPVLQEVCSNF